MTGAKRGPRLPGTPRKGKARDNTAMERRLTDERARMARVGRSRLRRMNDLPDPRDGALTLEAWRRQQAKE